MSFSVGILYSVQNFLKFINETPLKATDFSTSFIRYELTSPQIVLEVAESCNWIQLDTEGNLSITEKGFEILNQKDMLYALRVQLKHLIELMKPPWAYLIHKGRKEAFQFFPPEVKQCFKEAELINSYSKDVIEWWDILALSVRGMEQETKLEVGRTGEMLSFLYEKNRINKDPVWQSIESNLSGFDILSNISSRNSTPLLIEVKASTYTSGFFSFYLTRNEWNVAETAENYRFHLWILGDTPELFIIDKNDIVNHIPEDHGNGHWENVKITFTRDELINMDIKE